MTSRIRDRALLAGAAIAVLVPLTLVSYVDDVLGFNGAGFLVVFETVFVFGFALSYCRTLLPRWYTRAGDRALILGTFSILLVAHCVLAALVFRRLRFEWGMWVWMGISLAEYACVTAILEGVVGRAKRRRYGK